MHAELDKLVAALEEFYAREAYLLEKDAGERALSHRLAVCIERQFADWEVDCDYNRLGERALLLPRGTIVSTDDAFGKSVSIPISWCTGGPFRKIFWLSRSGRQPIISQSNTIGTSCGR